MKRLLHRNRTPHGGAYSIDRPELGVVGHGSTFKLFENSVRTYRQANGIPCGLGFSTELEEIVCGEYPSECNEKDPNLPPDKPIGRLGLNDVVAGTQTMIRFLAEGRPIVSQEEANRRSEICAGCRYNTPFPKSCGGRCGPLKDIVLKIVGNRSTTHHDKLQACQICSCFLEAAVWLPVDLQWQSLSDNQRSQFMKISWCWKNPDTTIL